MPDKPKTPIRAVRVPDDLWVRAQRVASERRETVTDVIRRALEAYVAHAPAYDQAEEPAPEA